jgi:hypothetical protein
VRQSVGPPTAHRNTSRRPHVINRPFGTQTIEYDRAVTGLAALICRGADPGGPLVARWPRMRAVPVQRKDMVWAGVPTADRVNLPQGPDTVGRACAPVTDGCRHPDSAGGRRARTTTEWPQRSTDKSAVVVLRRYREASWWRWPICRRRPSSRQQRPPMSRPR